MGNISVVFSANFDGISG